MSLTACLLTRNDESTVARAVQSVRGVADQVLVADTGSSDRTADAAASAGATVTQFVWEDDFAAGRNHLLEQAAGDWILWLDPKEELMPASVEPLREAISRDDAFGFFVRVRQVDADRGRVAAEAADLRLFRRRAGLRFVGRLHPHFEPHVAEAVKRDGLKVEPCEAVLQREAEAGPLGEAKLRWMARLLELELRDRPGQLHYLIEHGRTLLTLQDPRGHDVMAAAADVVRAAWAAPHPPSAKVQVLLQYLLTVDPEKSRSHLSREHARELALRWFASSPPLLWTMAEQRFRAGEYDRATNVLERLVRLGKSGTYDRSQPFSPDIVGEQAVINLGMCHQQLGRLAEAEACFLQLVASPTYGERARRQLDVIRRGRGN